MASFGDAVQSEAQLRALFPQPTHNSYSKQIDRLDGHCHELIAAVADRLRGDHRRRRPL